MWRSGSRRGLVRRRFDPCPARYHFQERSIRDASALSPHQLGIVLDFLHEHLRDAVSLQHLAQLAYLSSSHFARQFKRSTGSSPHRYHLNMRIGRAQDCLSGRATASPQWPQRQALPIRVTLRGPSKQRLVPHPLYGSENASPELPETLFVSLLTSRNVGSRNQASRGNDRSMQSVERKPVPLFAQPIGRRLTAGVSHISHRCDDGPFSKIRSQYQSHAGAAWQAVRFQVR